MHVFLCCICFEDASGVIEVSDKSFLTFWFWLRFIVYLSFISARIIDLAITISLFLDLLQFYNAMLSLNF